MTAALTTGLGLGFLVAAQVGPVWLLCVRSVLRGRVAAGLAIGARLGERVQRPIDVISGLALTCFGAYLGFATLRDS